MRRKCQYLDSSHKMHFGLMAVLLVYVLFKLFQLYKGDGMLITKGCVQCNSVYD